jgi:hypothetical protein
MPLGPALAQDDLIARVARLYAGDSQLDGLWQQVMQTKG